MPARVAAVFLKTAFYACFLPGRDQQGVHELKRKWAGDLLKTLGFELIVRGTPPAPGTCILVGNHMSYLDIPVVMASEGGAVFIAKDDLLRWPFIGIGAKAIGTIFVSRESGADRSATRESISRCLSAENNEKVVVFPAGTTTLDESRPWKKGIFEIAKTAKKPVQLFHIQYNPIREAAYIDDDNLLAQMAGLSKVKNKTATLTWLDCFDEVGEPESFAESLRLRVKGAIPAGIGT
jgi:1-acyl-sn-glycerol-3-phosphate acyltransferase